MKKLVVCGRFDTNGGKPSGYAHKMLEGMKGWSVVNGGRWSDLQTLIQGVKLFSAVLWMPDIPNDFPKLVPELKQINPKMILTISKNNRRREYNILELGSRLLEVKGNLMVVFDEDNSDKIVGSVIDPLGNIFIDKETNPSIVGRIIARRVEDLMKFTRIGSKSIGDSIRTPNEEEFFSIVRQYSKVFHEKVHGSSPTRFIGNASFRGINTDGFIAVELESNSEVRFYGNHKPSVDTPIQVSLYRNFPKIQYMLHSHCYIKDAFMTKEIIPCGAIEEVNEILEAIDNKAKEKYFINLKGHGSLAMVSSVQDLYDIQYIGRIPDYHCQKEN